MYARCLIVIIAFALGLNGGFGGGPKADDSKHILGTWAVVSVDGADKPPPEELKKLRIRITTDELIVQVDGKPFHTSKYKLDTTTSPKAMDLMVKVFVNETVRIVASTEPRLGIYQLSGDDLKICVAMATHKKTPDPSGRPKDFKTGGDLTVLTLKRDR
jgi:uncharacterized protein (TIGR03067 family)